MTIADALLDNGLALAAIVVVGLLLMAAWGIYLNWHDARESRKPKRKRCPSCGELVLLRLGEKAACPMCGATVHRKLDDFA